MKHLLHLYTDHGDCACATILQNITSTYTPLSHINTPHLTQIGKIDGDKIFGSSQHYPFSISNMLIL